MRQLKPRKRFGQHFLTDPGVIDAIVMAIHPRADDHIVEIGPGLAAITRPLARRAGRLDAIELDRDLASELKSQYANDANVRIHQADALQFDYASLGQNLRVVGNLPYNISTPILFRLLQQRNNISDMHFMLQKEVVDRMAAGPGSKTYGRLSVMLGCYLEVDALFDVDSSAFEPPPEVQSAVVRLRPRTTCAYVIDDHARLAQFVAAGFGQRRKTLRNALKMLLNSEDLRAAGIDPDLRAEQVPVPDWIALANRYSNVT